MQHGPCEIQYVQISSRRYTDLASQWLERHQDDLGEHSCYAEFPAGWRNSLYAVMYLLLLLLMSAIVRSAEENIPEIQRSHLAASILQLKAIGIENIMTFPWLDPPPVETAVRGMEQLYAGRCHPRACKVTVSTCHKPATSHYVIHSAHAAIIVQS
jgi:hypothetical protein